MNAGHIHRNHLIVVGLIAVAFFAFLFQTWIAKRSSNELKLRRNLPFDGQFPVARISGAQMVAKVGFPPIIQPNFPRDYGMFLLLNTLNGKMNCPSCKAFDQEFSSVASRVPAKQRLENKIHFATLEYADNHDLFMKIRIVQLPTIIYLPPTTKVPSSAYANAIRIYDNRQGPVPAHLATFFERTADIRLDAKKDTKYGIIIVALSAIMILAAIIKLYVRSSVLGMIFTAKLWAIISLGFMVVMTSGYMWVRIRGAPYTIFNNQHTTFYAAGLQTMLGIEAQIVGSLNGVAALALLALTTKIPQIENRRWRRLSVYSSLTIILLAFSAEIALFRRKVPSYPFRLLMS